MLPNPRQGVDRGYDRGVLVRLYGGREVEGGVCGLAGSYFFARAATVARCDQPMTSLAVGHKMSAGAARVINSSSEPMRSARSSAAAAFTVKAVNTSAGSNFICVQAMVPARGKFSLGHVPGLQSLARATATPRSISRRAGA